MRIFWPADLSKSGLAGVIVGWRNSALDVFVVAVLDLVDVGGPPPSSLLIADGVLTVHRPVMSKMR